MTSAPRVGRRSRLGAKAVTLMELMRTKLGPLSSVSSSVLGLSGPGFRASPIRRTAIGGGAGSDLRRHEDGEMRPCQNAPGGGHSGSFSRACQKSDGSGCMASLRDGSLVQGFRQSNEDVHKSVQSVATKPFSVCLFTLSLLPSCASFCSVPEPRG